MHVARSHVLQSTGVWMIIATIRLGSSPCEMQIFYVTAITNHSFLTTYTRFVQKDETAVNGRIQKLRRAHDESSNPEVSTADLEKEQNFD